MKTGISCKSCTEQANCNRPLESLSYTREVARDGKKLISIRPTCNTEYEGTSYILDTTAQTEQAA